MTHLRPVTTRLRLLVPAVVTAMAVVGLSVGVPAAYAAVTWTDVQNTPQTITIQEGASTVAVTVTTTFGSEAGPMGSAPYWFTNVPVSHDPVDSWVRWTFDRPVTSLKVSVTGMEGPDAATGDPEHYTVSDGSTVFANLGATGTNSGSNPVTWSGSTASCAFVGCQGFAEVSFPSGITWIQARGSSNTAAGWNGVGVALPSEQAAPPVPLDAVDDSGSGVTGVAGDHDVLVNDTAPSGSTAALVGGGTASGSAAMNAGVVTYTPTVAEAGSTVTQLYKLCPAGQTATPPCDTATLFIAVTMPAAPVAPALTTTGVGTAEQQTDPVRPVGGTLFLLDADQPVTSIATTQGSFYVFEGALLFTPRDGVSGTMPAVTYEITDAFGRSSVSTYTATVSLPAPPVAPDVTTSRGPGLEQTTDPTSGTGNPRAMLLGAGGTEVDELVVAGVGTYRAFSGDGVQLTFRPVACFVGTAPAVTYRLTDSYAQTDEGTYTATVTAPTPPAAAPVTSSGTGTAAHTVTVAPPPCGGTVHLVDGAGNAVTTLVNDGEGSYTVDPDTGTIMFTPELGFIGPATPVAYRLTDSQGQNANSIYTATVAAPGGPSAIDQTSTGVGVDLQSVTPSVPTGGSITLLDGGVPNARYTVPGQGIYTLDPDTGRITFTPVLGYAGTVSPVSFRLTDAYGQVDDATYIPTVTAPAAPVASHATSTGSPGGEQSRTFTVPTGGSITLLSGTTPVTELTVAGQGRYVLDTATGRVTFTPVAGFTGTATPVSYRITDAYGQSDTGEYTPTVNAAPAVVPPAADAPASPRAGAPSPATPSAHHARLARTGSDPIVLLGIALALMLSGAAALASGRPRL